MGIDLTTLPNYRPYTNIQPFTVRDGATYLLVLEGMREWLRDTLVPHLDKEINELAETWGVNAEDIKGRFDTLAEELVTRVDTAVEGVDADAAAALAAKAASEAARDLAAQYASDAAEVQDSTVTGLVNSEATSLRTALESLFASASVQEAVEDGRLSADALAASFVDKALTESGYLAPTSLDDKYENYYFPSEVVYVSPTGNDTFNGRAPRKAFKTIKAAVESGAKLINVLPGTHNQTEMIDVPAGVRIIGGGKDNTIVLSTIVSEPAAFVLGNNSKISDLTINGVNSDEGATGILLAGNTGRQVLSDVDVTMFYPSCILFESQAGSQFRGVNVGANCRDSLTGGSRYAVAVATDTAPAGAVPRSFVNFQSQGSPAFNFGGCDNFYISNSTIGDLRYTNDSRGVSIVASRILNQMLLEIKGHNNSILACNINPEIQIMPGTDNVTLSGSFNRDVIDKSGNGRNNVTHFWKAYTPIITGGNGGTFDIGNGTLMAYYSRSGSRITIDIRLTVGSTTVLPAGELRIGLPYDKSVTLIQEGSAGRIVSGSTVKTLTYQIPATTYVRLYPVDSNSPISSASPVAMAPGTELRFSCNYNQ